MKKFNKVISFAIAFVMLISTFAVSAFAAEASVEEMQKSTVYIEVDFVFKAKNYGVSTIRTARGTGFAIAEKGKDVEYIGTCAHVIHDEGGVYAFTVDANGEIDNIQEAPSITNYPIKTTTDDGVTIYADYFETSFDEGKVFFSKASDDYSKIKVVKKDLNSDVAVCKLLAGPTDKLKPAKFITSEDVKAGDTVYAIGYPTISDFVDGDDYYTYEESTVTKGVVAKPKTVDGRTEDGDQYTVYQIDANIEKGNSGGPLFTEDGYIAGINAFGVNLRDVELGEINYSVAVDSLLDLLDEEEIEYDVYGRVNVGVIIAVVVAVAAVGAAIVVFFVFSNKNKAQPAVQAASASGVNATVAMNAPSPAVVSNGKYYLIGVSGMFSGKKYSIEDRAIIGRDPARCNVVYPENQPGISGIHCEIVRNDNALVITDCGSTYGTYLGNGTRLAPKTPYTLRSGEKFYVGNNENTFEVRY